MEENMILGERHGGIMFTFGLRNVENCPNLEAVPLVKLWASGLAGL